MESDVSSQRSVIEESKGHITMLENILAKEAVVHHKLLTCSVLRPTQSPTLNRTVAMGYRVVVYLHVDSGWSYDAL